MRPCSAAVRVAWIVIAVTGRSERGRLWQIKSGCVSQANAGMVCNGTGESRMARRKVSLLDEIASLPWLVGVALGIIAFLFVRQVAGGVLAPLAWLFLAGCWMAAVVSFFRTHKRKQLLETQIGLDSLARTDWREFEMLVGEAFRRRGYFVEETGLGGKDGGIDLIVSKGGRKELVQCKQWRTRRVRASTVREMWGLVDHHGADAVHIVCIGDFTPDAAAFARGKAIELIDGERLLEMVRDVQRNANAVASSLPSRIEPAVAPKAVLTPLCPACGSGMVQRRNRLNGEQFWGCPSYPRCRGTRHGRVIEHSEHDVKRQG